MAEILDCTLRDGSYAIDFGFTAEQTAQISGTLHELGFPYIEVGHGVGMGASRAGYGVAACSDHAYATSARGTWGMFCIPGIADLIDLEDMAELGMKFVRIGCNVDAVREAVPFIKRARDLGLYVFSNLMKSYTASPEQFGEVSKVCVDAGAQCIYVVDSAGGMVANEILKYQMAIKDSCGEIRTGFHGHNNIGLAVANAVAAGAFGFDVIDCSLQGLGRSAGNVPTEQFLAAMNACGRNTNQDLLKVCEISETLIRPLVRHSGIASLDVVAGVSQFHSSYMQRLLRVAKDKHVSPLELIVAVSEEDKVNCPEDLLYRCAEKLTSKYYPSSQREYHGEEQYRQDSEST